MAGTVDVAPPALPVLVYDGGCGFCARCVALLPRLRLRAGSVVGYQDADLARLGLTQAACAAEVQWVTRHGAVGGHRAVAGVLVNSGRFWRIAGRAMLLPPLSWAARAGYRLVARNRSCRSRTEPALRAAPDWMSSVGDGPL